MAQNGDAPRAKHSKDSLGIALGKILTVLGVGLFVFTVWALVTSEFRSNGFAGFIDYLRFLAAPVGGVAVTYNGVRLARRHKSASTFFLATALVLGLPLLLGAIIVAIRGTAQTHPYAFAAVAGFLVLDLAVVVLLLVDRKRGSLV